jgi:predicted acyl esterase
VCNQCTDRLRQETAKEVAVTQAFLQQDFAAWAAFQASRDRGERDLIAHTTVPILAHTSWHDDYLSPTSLIDLLATLPAATPRSILIETGDHRSPANYITRALRTERELRWLAHFLKGCEDELPEQTTFHLGVVPDDIGGYLGGLTLWPFRQASDWPDRAVTVRETLHLRAGAVLAPSPAPGSEPADAVQHQVAPGFDPQAWIATGNDTQTVFAAIPLSQALFRTAPRSEDQELHGRPTADLWIDSNAPHLQLGLALLDEAPDGTTRYLTGGQLALRDRSPGAEAVRVELGGCATTVRAGHRLVLAVENHVWHRPPNQSLLRTAPYFASYQVDVLHTDLRPSKLELPFLPRPGFSIRAANTRVSASQGGTTYLELRGHTSRAGAPYAVLMSLSGTTPGTSVLGSQVPINFDAMTQAVLAGAGPPALPSFVGTLGIDGRANAYFVARPGLIPASLAGTEMAFSAVTLTAEGLVPATFTDVRILP